MEFTPLAKIDVERDPIFALAFSPSGTWLGAGGTGGAMIWRLSNARSVAVPRERGLRGPVSSMAWTIDEGQEILYFGTGLGYLVAWKHANDRFVETFGRRLGNGVELMAILPDATNGRIVVAMRDGVVQSWNTKSDSAIHQWTAELNATVPTSIALSDNATKDILVFGAYTGVRHTIGGQDGAIIATERTDIVMGRVAVSTRKNVFIVDNGVDGFDVHDLDSNGHLVNLTTGRVMKSFPKQVHLISHDTIVVGGSDHGIVYVFERKTGKVLCRLRHSRRGLVQTIATYETETGTRIASASSEVDKGMQIIVWAKTDGDDLALVKPATPRYTRDHWFWKCLDILVRVLTGLVTLFYVWQAFMPAVTVKIDWKVLGTVARNSTGIEWVRRHVA